LISRRTVQLNYREKIPHTRRLAMAESIGDESIFLWLYLLKKGLVQFTDATTAARLFREHGRDIRYNAAWKKWIVWENTHWQMDDGALIHEKGLEMIRNIYNDLLKTADYRDRMEIEKYAMLSESVRPLKCCVSNFDKAFVEAASWIKALNITSDDPDTNPWLLNVRNGTLDGDHRGVQGTPAGGHDHQDRPGGL
jgi:putative DNA primase/helicase